MSLSMLAAGCAVIAPHGGVNSVALPDARSATYSAATVPAPSADDAPRADANRPKPKPFGVVIAYPVVEEGASAEARDLAAGIGWYMADAVAGAPELGQSPLRTTVAQAARSRAMPSLHLSADQA